MAETLNPTLSTYHFKSRKRKYSPAGVNIVETYIVPLASRGAFEADFPIAAQHPTYTTAYLNDVDEEPVSGDNGGTAAYKYVLTYGPRSARIAAGGSPDTVPVEEGETVVIVSGSSNPQNVPIDRNLNYDSNTWPNTKAGVDSYIAPAPQFVCRFITKIPDGQIDNPTIEHNKLTKNVGRRFSGAEMTAYHLDGAPDNAYLLYDISITNGETNTETAYTFLFSPPPGWDPDIYLAAEV